MRVLLLVPERLGGRSYLRALHRATVEAECVGTVAELEARARAGDSSTPVLVMVLSPAGGALRPRALAGLASRLSANARTRLLEPPARGAKLADAFREYAASRGLSPRQERVLQLYLDGHNDKSIAAIVHCSETTVYEHWRRMARKAAGINKSDAVTDFHRFLTGAGAGVAPGGHDRPR